MKSIRKPHPYDLKIEGVTIFFNEVLNGWALPGCKKSEAQRALKRIWRASRGEK